MTAITIFFSYAQEDEPLLAELKKHLQPFKRQGLIAAWYDHNIAAGLEWMQEQTNRLNTATLITLLISPDYLNSDHIYSTEMRQAMLRHESGNARVLPIFLRPVYWEETPFATLQFLPSDARPITTWEDRDKAFVDVTTGVSRVLKEIRAQSIHHSEEPPSSSHTPSHLFTVPFRRDPFFTGRIEILDRIHSMLTSEKVSTVVQPPAITGMGGIGKTQTVIEYAYQHRKAYQNVFWVRSATKEEVGTDLAIIASLLNLPEKNSSSQEELVSAVKHWLEIHTNWLMIFDNVNDLEMVAQYFPLQTTGHILLTTQAQIMGGVAQQVDLKEMSMEEGSLLLLRRAKILSSKSSLEQALKNDIMIAKQIVRELNGLPLALNQAGAYIEESRCGLSKYLDIYKKHRSKLLLRRGSQATLFGHPESVVTTWKLSFTKVELASTPAADLLRLCAFLAPVAIPEDIFSECASDLGPILGPIVADAFAFDNAIGELLKYSLIHRDPNERILTIHGLVQAVIKDEMNEELQIIWAERSIKLISYAFPNIKFDVWEQCERLLPHAQACFSLIKHWNFSFVEAAMLLSKVGFYLEDRQGQLREVEVLYQHAYLIYKHVLGTAHPHTVTTLNSLAGVYRTQGRYAEAEELYKQVREVKESTLGAKHPEVITILNSLAGVYRTQGRYAEAEELYKQVREVKESILGAKHPDTADALYNLALLYQVQKRYTEAENLYLQALNIDEQAYGFYHVQIINDLQPLALLYHDQGKDSQAKDILQRIADVEKHL